MKKLFVLLTIFPMFHVVTSAQYRKSIAISGGGSYGLTLWEQGSLNPANRIGSMQMAEMNIKAGYYILPQWELGGRLAGCGALNADVSAIYLSLATQYDATPRLFVGLDAGLPLSMGDITEGFIANVDLGYRVWQHSSGWSLNASLGYRFMDYAYARYEGDNVSSVYEERFSHGLHTGFCLEYTFASTLPQGKKEAVQRRKNRKEYWITEAILFLFELGAARFN
jgi:hypothetical protein